MNFNADNGRLFLAQSTDSHKKVNFTNADTSLSTVCCNKPFLLEGKNIYISCYKRYSTPDTMICRPLISKFWASNELGPVYMEVGDPR